MAYQQINEILQAVRRVHRQHRRDAETRFGDTSDPRSQYLLRHLSQSERQMDQALREYEEDGTNSVLETWIQYIPDDDLQATILEGKLPPGATPDEVLEWRRKMDVALVDFYHQLASQVSATRAVELFESLAGLAEQRLTDHIWQGRDDDLAPNHET